MIEEKNRQSRSYQAPQLPSQLIWGSVRFIFFSIVILFLIIAGLFVYYRWEIAASGSRIVIDEGAPELGAAERLVLQGFLSFNANRLAESASISELDKTTFFTIDAGSNANQVAINLVKQGLVAPQRGNLFLNYFRFYWLDSMLEAGKYEIPPKATIPELAGILTDSVGGKVELRFLEGWRSEEIANYLRVTRPAKIDSAEFLAIVNRTQPFDLSPYPFLAQLTPTDSLEGFLFPDQYRVSVEATAAELIQQMLKITPRTMMRRHSIQMTRDPMPMPLSLFHPGTVGHSSSGQFNSSGMNSSFNLSSKLQGTNFGSTQAGMSSASNMMGFASNNSVVPNKFTSNNNVGMLPNTVNLHHQNEYF